MTDIIPDDFEDGPFSAGATDFIDSEMQDDFEENAPVAQSGKVGYLSRTPDEAIAWGRRQMTNPTQDWTLRCQSFVRQCYNVPAWAPSAQAAWDRIPNDQKVKGGHPSDAPRAAAIYFRGGQWGHVMLAIGKATDTNALSNDYVERGMIDVVARTIPNWNMEYLGWSAWTPYGSMRVVKPLWDGVVPDPENVRSNRVSDTAGLAVWRVAARLYDLGYYTGEPPVKYEQKYPEKAIVKFQLGFGGKGSGNYGSKTHRLLFDL
jgi:hypothetical protein